MIKMPKVSVVMPVYNTPEEYLRQAVESVLNQTFKDFELIILDDGSTNNVAEVIRSYTDNRIRFVQNGTNKGISFTRNRLIELALGEYIAIADSDDLSLPTRFEKQVHFLDTHPDFSLVGTWYERFPDYFVPKFPEQVGLMDMLKWCAIAQPVVMYRKADFEKHNLTYDKEMIVAEDYDLWVTALIKGLKLGNIPEVLIKYRWHPDNVSHKKQKQMAYYDRIVKQKIVSHLSGDTAIQNKLMDFFVDRQPTFNYKKIYLFGKILLFKIKYKGNKTKGYLFGFLPIFKVKGKK